MAIGFFALVLDPLGRAKTRQTVEVEQQGIERNECR